MEIVIKFCPPINYIVITGKFNLEQRKPYFVSLAVDQAKLTYVGNIPERVRFELKVKGTEGVNYIVLPLDTTIKKASDICKSISLFGENRVGYWDISQQELISHSCDEIIYYGLDFNVNPGGVYFITLNSNKEWTQE